MILDKIKQIHQQLRSEADLINTRKLPELEVQYRTVLTPTPHPFLAYQRHYQKQLQAHALRYPAPDSTKWHPDSLFFMGGDESSESVVTIRDSVMKRV